MATFTYTPDFGAAPSYEPRVRVARFGDGYEQRVGDGINTMRETWPLTFAVRDDTETAAILAFLVARGGVEAFDWTPPGEGAAKRWICRKWSRSWDSHDKNTINATFERVYE